MNELAQEYTRMSEAAVLAAIREAKARLGDSVTILGHHYQSDDVIQFADFRGDSLDLSRHAAEAVKASYIVFCGAHFMAESAAILCSPAQTVIAPALEAFCPMANMAGVDDVAEAWSVLSPLWNGDVLPITYQNSTAVVKAFTGEHGGAVCTSSNATQVFEWAFEHAQHILFMPDEHLGTNTALATGIPRERIGLWNPVRPPDPTTLEDCRVVVWRGFCYVHTRFSVADVEAARQRYPEALIAVHPECTHDVVSRSDLAASTTGIIRAVEEAPAGTTIVIGTEWNLINRLSHEHIDKQIVPLCRSTCKTMSMTTPRHLLSALDGLVQGTPRNVVRVDPETARGARAALERMLEAR